MSTKQIIIIVVTAIFAFGAYWVKHKMPEAVDTIWYVGITGLGTMIAINSWQWYDRFKNKVK